jgi:hypothetical protein
MLRQQMRVEQRRHQRTGQVQLGQPRVPGRSPAPPAGEQRVPRRPRLLVFQFERHLVQRHPELRAERFGGRRVVAGDDARPRELRPAFRELHRGRRRGLRVPRRPAPAGRERLPPRPRRGTTRSATPASART